MATREERFQTEYRYCTSKPVFDPICASAIFITKETSAETKMERDDEPLFSENEEVVTYGASDDEDLQPNSPVVAQAPPSFWTVAPSDEASRVPIPATNNLLDWTIEQLRLECKARKAPNLRGKGEKSKRIAFIQESENDRDIARCVADPTGWHLRKIDHTIIRLINVLFSDAFVHRLVRSEDQLTRAQIEAKEFGGNSKFWQDVHVEFSTNTADFNGKYIEDDPRYDKVQPSIITDHGASALYKLWKDLLPLYRVAYNNSTVSGQHDNDFLNYCNGRLDINYLHAVVGQRQVQVMNFVRGGMPTETQLDSTKPGQNRRGKGKNTRDSKGRVVDEEAGLQNTLSELTTLFKQQHEQRSVTPTPATIRMPSLLDSMTKTHALISQLKATLEEDEMNGRRNPKLVDRIVRMEAVLDKLENECDEVMGLQPPPKRARRSVDEDTDYSF